MNQDKAIINTSEALASKRLAIVLLVAGQAKRMGQNKQLLPWRSGTILDSLCYALTTGMPDAALLVAVTGDDHNELASILQQYGFMTVQNNEPRLGQGESLRIGMGTMVAEQDSLHFHIDGVLCSVGDQPLLMPSVVTKLVDAFVGLSQDDAIVVPVYGENRHRGNPVIFGSHWFKALAAIEGDEGGRSIIRRVPSSSIVDVEITDDVGIDVDTPEEYHQLMCNDMKK